MHESKHCLIDSWPVISFKEIEHIEIEQKGVRVFYQSFFRLLNLPETALKALYIVLKNDPSSSPGKEMETCHPKSTPGVEVGSHSGRIQPE